MKKRDKKLRLNRETLCRLEPAALRDIAGGTTVPTLEVSCLCTQEVTQCGEVTCGPCANTVVNCDPGEPGG